MRLPVKLSAFFFIFGQRDYPPPPLWINSINNTHNAIKEIPGHDTSYENLTLRQMSYRPFKKADCFVFTSACSGRSLNYENEET